MKLNTIILLFFVVISQTVCTSQTSEQNYIRTFDVRFPNINPSLLNLNTSAMEATQTIQYYDGLGRLTQTVQVGAAFDGSDIIIPVKYNNVGLDEWNYLPYPSLDERGSFRGEYNAEQTLFYNTEFGPNSPGLSPIDYERSPLNRVLRQGSPGAEWQLDPDDHFLRFSYLSNTNSDPKLSVKLWKWDGTDCKSDNNYEINQLYVNKTVNEDRAETYEFKDKQGQLVLKRAVLENGTLVDTYYVYDDFGLLRFVISPEGSAQLGNSFNASTELARQFVYCYIYDDRKRLIEKQIPGKGPEYYVYNKNDQVVMYQDGNMRKFVKGNTPAYEWQFTKYEALGRVIMTGITKQFPSESRQTIQNSANNSTGKCWEILYCASTTRPTDNNFYTNNAFPVLSGTSQIQTLNYYDTYRVTLMNATSPILICDKSELTAAGTTGSNPTIAPFSGQVTGLPTVSYIQFEPQSLFLANITYYDLYNRATRSSSEHHLQGYDQNTMEYSGLTELVTKIIHKHYAKKKKVAPYDYTYIKEGITSYGFDHAGRQVSFRYSFNGSPSYRIINNTYNQRGQLESRQIGEGNYLVQKVDYVYNIKGWLTTINDPSDLTTEGDLFGMELLYNTKNTQINNEARYNGNISGIRWQTAQPYGTTTPVTTGVKAYSYLYDNLNRLLTSSFFETPANGGSLYQSDRYSEFIHTGSQAQGYRPYDLNGNIKTINRFGMKSPNNSLGLIDQLTYYYKGNQLIGVNDLVTTNNSGDFLDNGQIINPEQTSTWEYAYDANGNMIRDNNKGILSISYNNLNLPASINKSGGLRVEYQYDAAGTKRKQIYFTNIEGTVSKETDFIGNFVYENGVPAYNVYDEGRIVYNPDGTYFGEAFIKDHLGNVRVTCRMDHGQVRVRQVDSYYSFGMNIKGLSQNSTDQVRPNEYLYNGKMIQDEMGLGWLDYGARFYNPVLGRWNSVDPKAEIYTSWSPYNYCYNNPINFIDPDGKVVEKPDTKKTYTDQATTYTYTYNGNDSHSVSQTTTTNTYTYDNESGKWDQKTVSSTSTITFSGADGKFTETGGTTELNVSNTKGNLSLNKDERSGKTSNEFIAKGKTETKSSTSNFSSEMMASVDKGNFSNCINGVQNWLSDNGMKNTPLTEAYKDYRKDVTKVGYAVSLVRLLLGSSSPIGWVTLGSSIATNSANDYYSKPENRVGESIILTPVKKKE
jgi:RHS repeat-associated protein